MLRSAASSGVLRSHSFDCLHPVLLCTCAWMRLCVVSKALHLRRHANVLQGMWRERRSWSSTAEASREREILLPSMPS